MLTKLLRLLVEEVISDRRLVVIPLEAVVAVEEVAPFSASSESVT